MLCFRIWIIAIFIVHRLAYLKKHIAVHQLTINHTSVALSHSLSHQPLTLPMQEHSRHHPPLDAAARLYQNQPLAFRQYYPNGRYPTLFPELEKRHFHALQEFYMQQSERMSAFRYAKQQELDAYLKRWVMIIIIKCYVIECFQITDMAKLKFPITCHWHRRRSIISPQWFNDHQLCGLYHDWPQHQRQQVEIPLPRYRLRPLTTIGLLP